MQQFMLLCSPHPSIVNGKYKASVEIQVKNVSKYMNGSWIVTFPKWSAVFKAVFIVNWIDS